MELMNGKYSEIEWVKSNEQEEQNHIKNKNPDQFLLAEEEWAKLRYKFPLPVSPTLPLFYSTTLALIT